MKVKVTELKVGDILLLDWNGPSHICFITDIEFDKYARIPYQQYRVNYSPTWGGSDHFWCDEGFEVITRKTKKVKLSELKKGDKLQLTWYIKEQDRLKFAEIADIVKEKTYYRIDFIPNSPAFNSVYFDINIESRLSLYTWGIRILDEALETDYSSEHIATAKILGIETKVKTKKIITILNGVSFSEQVKSIVKQLEELEKECVNSKFSDRSCLEVEIDSLKSKEQLTKEILNKLS